MWGFLEQLLVLFRKPKSFEERFRRAFGDELPQTPQARNRLRGRVISVLAQAGAKALTLQAEEARSQVVPLGLAPDTALGSVVWSSVVSSNARKAERNLEELQVLALGAGFSQGDLAEAARQAKVVGSQGGLTFSVASSGERCWKEKP